jgi:hypothetical protein
MSRTISMKTIGDESDLTKVKLDMATDQLVLLPSKFDRKSMSIPVADKRETPTVGKIQAQVLQITQDEKLDFEQVWERLSRRDYIRVWLDRDAFTSDRIEEMWSNKFCQFNEIVVIFSSYKNKDGPGVGIRMVSAE